MVNLKQSPGKEKQVLGSCDARRGALCTIGRGGGVEIEVQWNFTITFTHGTGQK